MAGGLKEVRERITSVQNTMQITSAMKMVAAAKLRKAQESAERGRPYSEKMQNIILNLLENLIMNYLSLLYSLQYTEQKLLIIMRILKV